MLTLWGGLAKGWLPSFLSPTVERTLYFKLPIDGTRFHWTFLDRRALLAGELTVRIISADRDRDETLVIFRNGKISDGWKMIGGEPTDSSVYFGFATADRYPTSQGDSVIITLTAKEPLRGRGPYTEGTLAAGTWVATGTYHSLYGGTLNPFAEIARLGKPPIAFLTCWDTTWVLSDVRNQGWMGPSTGPERASAVDKLMHRGVDWRRCHSTQ